MVNNSSGADRVRWRGRATTSATSVSRPRRPSTWTPRSENLLRAQGYTIGEVVVDADDFAARRAEINAATDGRGARRRGRQERPHQVRQGQGRGQRPGSCRDPAGLHVHELRRPLPLRRGAQRPARRHHRPGDVVHVHEPERHVAGRSTCPTAASARTAATPRSAATSSPTATPAPARGTCTTAAWSRCAARTRTCRPRDVTVRVADANGNFDTSRRHRVGEQRRSRRASTAYQKDFITKYMDPTEIDTRMDQLDRAATRTSCSRSTCRTRRAATSARAWR